MKVIGDVTPKFDEEGNTVNVNYVGGCIIMLTSREASIFRDLQKAAKSEKWRFPFPDERTKPDDIKMDTLFWLVRQFTEAKFAINEFKGTIERLDDILMKAEAR